jgi:hypothetical protein
MTKAIVFLSLLILLGGCATTPTTYAPVATAPTTYVTTAPTYAPTTVYVPSPTYIVPSATYIVPNTAIVPNTTYVPSASPAYYTTMEECRRARGTWYSATSLCEFRR